MFPLIVCPPRGKTCPQSPSELQEACTVGRFTWSSFSCTAAVRCQTQSESRKDLSQLCDETRLCDKSGVDRRLTWLGCQGWCPRPCPLQAPLRGCSHLGSSPEANLQPHWAQQAVSLGLRPSAGCQACLLHRLLQSPSAEGPGSPAGGRGLQAADLQGARPHGAWWWEPGCLTPSPPCHPVGWTLCQHRGKPLHTGNEVRPGLLLPKPHSGHTTGFQVTTPAARLVYTSSSFPTCLPRRNSEKINIAEVKGSQELVGWGWGQGENLRVIPEHHH